MRVSDEIVLTTIVMIMDWILRMVNGDKGDASRCGGMRLRQAWMLGAGSDIKCVGKTQMCVCVCVQSQRSSHSILGK